MIKRKRLGQHFLNSKSIAEKIIFEANITDNDIVFELGTGLGILTPLLCEKAKKVITIEKDEALFQEAKKNFSKIKNLTIKYGDGFKTRDRFTIFVSNLPYSKSKDAIEWLATIPFSHGVIMVQKEFAEKLLTKSNKKRRAVSIVANHAFEIQNMIEVGKKNFTPNPKIDSIVLKIVKKQTLEKDLIEILNKIFSYRRKKISNILKQFGKKSSLEKRLDDLSVKEIVELAQEIRY
ncbi:MAG TPA: rRNA adenine dimethyltransferase family protein [Nitrosopumilaceae archaeon]|nr:rRNA adenine dimethyltransferase family protein [Nitrosopumilaceae archaeon]